MKSTTIILLILSLLFTACSTIKLKTRTEDIKLSKSNFQELQGIYSNESTDSLKTSINLFSVFADSIKNQEGAIIHIEPINTRTLEVNLIQSDTILNKIALKGKIKRGYFKVKRNWGSEFILGPFLYIVSEDLKYIGLNQQEDLIVLSSGGNSTMLMLVFPVFAGGGNQYELIYQRKQQQ